MVEINYKRLDKLDDFEIALVHKISEREFGKVKRNLANASLVVDIKKINREGRRAAYEVKARVDAPSLVLHGEHTDWELQRALHRTFDNLKNEIERKFNKKKVKWPKRLIRE